MERQHSRSPHPSEVELAAYLGGQLDDDALVRTEAHLAECQACRLEIIEAADILKAAEILKTRPRVRTRVLAPLVAAAAVAVLLVPTMVADRFIPEPADHRDAAVEVPVAPTPLAPMGEIAEAGAFVWTPVPGADRYRVRLFNDAGTVLWETTTVDSRAFLSDSVVLEPGQTYLWEVEARVGWDVWESSGLIEFGASGAVAPPGNPGG